MEPYVQTEMEPYVQMKLFCQELHYRLADEEAKKIADQKASLEKLTRAKYCLLYMRAFEESGRAIPRIGLISDPEAQHV